MFSDFEKLQKEKAFNYSKLRFENMNDFLNDKTRKFKDEYTNYSYILITISNFISYKEDIWIKNKKTKTIATNFSKEILDNFIFNGNFKSTKIYFTEYKKQNHYSLTPIKINNILQGKENDSIWIIDNIRDSIAHGHYYINFDNNTVIINNIHPDRLLNCEMKFDLFVGLNELITEERIGGYTDKMLTTTPILHMNYEIGKPTITRIKDENELKDLLKNRYIVSYCQVTDVREKDNDKKYNDLVKFYNFNVRVMEEIYRKFNLEKNIDISEHYTKKMSSYINDQMQNYDVTIFSKHIGDELINKIVEYIKEQPDFFTRNIDDQSLILHEILRSVLSHEKITIERGVTDIVELYNHSALKHTITNVNEIKELNKLIFSNANSFRENKKLANLFILGTTNFVSNKESIYDKYFEDYNEFDISNFEYQDYSGYNKLVNNLKVKNSDLSSLNNSLKKANDNKNNLIKNLANAPDDKKHIIQSNINRINVLINELNKKINVLVSEINDIATALNTHKTDSNGNYINNNNKNFFNHLRNAFAHTNISYYDDRLVYNRKILLEDYDDENNLTFRCVCRYYDLVKLFNNKLFIEAINDKPKEKRK